KPRRRGMKKTYAERIRAMLNDPNEHPYEFIEVPASPDADEDNPHNRIVKLPHLTVADLRLAEAGHRQRALATFQAQIRYANNLAALLACLTQANPPDAATVGQIAEQFSVDDEEVEVFCLMRAGEDPERTTEDILNDLRRRGPGAA